MQVRSLIDRPEINFEKGKLYELAEDNEESRNVLQDSYKIKIPKKQQGKFNYALIKDDEGKLVE